MLAQPLVSIVGANLFLLKPVGLGFLTFATDTFIAFGMKFRFLSEAYKAFCYLTSFSSQPHLSSPSALYLMFWQEEASLKTLVIAFNCPSPLGDYNAMGIRLHLFYSQL